MAEKERKGIEDEWPMKDVDPCFQYARIITAIECHLGSAVRHILRGDGTSANGDLVVANQNARDLSVILPAARKDSDALAKGAEAIRVKIRAGKEIPKKDRGALVGRISALNPALRGLFVRGHGACRRKRNA